MRASKRKSWKKKENQLKSWKKLDEEEAGWQRWLAGGETCMRTAGGDIWGNPAQLSLRKLAFLYFPHIFQLQMKQERESTNEEVHFKVKKSWEKGWWNSCSREKCNTQITGWIHDILDDKCISSYLCVRALASAVSKSVIAVWCSQSQRSRDASKIRASESFPEWWKEAGSFGCSVGPNGTWNIQEIWYS